MSSREQILGRIRAALADDKPVGPVPREYLRSGEHRPGSEHVIELLIDRLVDYRAIVHRVNPADLGAAVDRALDGLQEVVVATGLDQSIAGTCGWQGRRVTTDTPEHPLTPQELDAVDVVVTTAKVAVALTGTIILDGGAGQGRRAITLVPDRHVLILEAGQVVETVAEAIALLTPTAPLTMIAGPSATSDIELERVEGVHGPRTLHVLISG